MLAECWASIPEGGRTFNKHYVAYHITWEYDWEELSPSKHPTLNQCWFNVGPASQTMGQH